jgi:hypothetical protein
MLRFAQGLIPLGPKMLTWFPERPSQLVLGWALARFPKLWGISIEGTRVQKSRRAFELAFPDEDADELLADWMRARGRGMATTLGYLARWSKGRRTRLMRTAPEFKLPEGPCVVAFLHFSFEPIGQLACIAASPDDLNIRLPIMPMQPGLEDDRALWLGNQAVPSRIDDAFLPVTDPSWMATAVDHLRAGGTIFISIDSPFDSSMTPESSISVGQAQMPLSPSVELFARVENVQLAFAWPTPKSRSSWVIDVKPAADVEELAKLSGEWIEEYRQHWAGLTFLVWREKVTEMRANVKKIQARSVKG